VPVQVTGAPGSVTRTRSPAGRMRPLRPRTGQLYRDCCTPICTGPAPTVAPYAAEARSWPRSRTLRSHLLRRHRSSCASLDIDLTDEEPAALEAHYTPRDDFQGISDDAVLARISERIPGLAPAGA
jgi:hypothetical protein